MLPTLLSSIHNSRKTRKCFNVILWAFDSLPIAWSWLFHNPSIHLLLHRQGQFPFSCCLCHGNCCGIDRIIGLYTSNSSAGSVAKPTPDLLWASESSVKAALGSISWTALWQPLYSKSTCQRVKMCSIWWFDGPCMRPLLQFLYVALVPSLLYLCSFLVWFGL